MIDPRSYPMLSYSYHWRGSLSDQLPLEPMPFEGDHNIEKLHPTHL